ncbi:uncharacterized protein LOC128238432 [Mya arenaria]|uniref:uncharacterized protein LOC128238432 n=1 Tax=Mya arenaria TaxID=6604 RepID=UPI0022E1347C|nr:uncharacterized protein LOC128238432 [Mya arenaria]XP_052810313.1 uncharacterized protein LOC128238432 [Mya arenaria]XP_052810314.1 uncharacterized protein LOC128238432 [Mya arenaria]
MLFKYTLVLVVCVVLLDPSDAWGRKIKKGLKKAGKSIKKVVKKHGCKALFSFACPAGVAAAGAAVAVGSGGTGAAGAAAGVVAGQAACSVGGKKTCKRSVDMNVNIVPFSDNIRDYDVNGDKLVDYEEFVFSIMTTINLAKPMELRKPFTFADVNGDGTLDTQEFNAAPFLFAHVEHSQSTNKI